MVLLHSMNRIDRLSAILVQLQSRPLVKAQQIADRFEISLRTVYRDIRALEQAGIPLIGNAGIGYSLVEGYKLPPLMFTREEALAFLTAEKLIDELTDPGSIAHYRSGMEKIRAVMRFTDKSTLDSMDRHIGILQTHKPQAPSSENKIQFLLQSIDAKRVLRLTYRSESKKEVSQRDIEPIGVFFSRISWYLIAFCRVKKAYRTFKINRIQHIEETDIGFTTQHPPLIDFLHEVKQKDGLEKVVISLPTHKLRIINDEKYYYGWIGEKDVENLTQVSFLTFSLDRFAQWYLTFAEHASIIEPDQLKKQL